jgi:hypothetical protein
MGEACGTYGGEARCVQNFGEELWKHHFEDTGIVGLVIILR